MNSNTAQKTGIGTALNAIQQGDSVHYNEITKTCFRVDASVNLPVSGVALRAANPGEEVPFVIPEDAPTASASLRIKDLLAYLQKLPENAPMGTINSHGSLHSVYDMTELSLYVRPADGALLFGSCNVDASLATDKGLVLLSNYEALSAG